MGFSGCRLVAEPGGGSSLTEDVLDSGPSISKASNLGCHDPIGRPFEAQMTSLCSQRNSYANSYAKLRSIES